MFMQPTAAAKLQTLTPEKLEELITDARIEFEEKILNNGNPSHFENLIMIATKAWLI